MRSAAANWKVTLNFCSHVTLQINFLTSCVLERSCGYNVERIVIKDVDPPEANLEVNLNITIIIIIIISYFDVT